MKMIKAAVYFFCISILLCTGCGAASTRQQAQKEIMDVGAYTFKSGNGWGYSITLDNQLFIKQASIPVYEGNRSFTTEADAAKIAALVIGKIKAHKKPVISKEELLQYGIR
jgi:Domain of unknown function (DUF4907)